MDYLFESVGGKNEDAVIYLGKRAEQLRKDAEDAEKQLEDYMRQHNLVSLDKSIDIISDRLKSVSAALTTARLEMLGVQELVQEVSDFRKQGKDLLEISYIANNGAVPTLKAQLSDAEQTQALLMQRLSLIHISGFCLPGGARALGRPGPLRRRRRARRPPSPVRPILAQGAVRHRRGSHR